MSNATRSVTFAAFAVAIALSAAQAQPVPTLIDPFEGYFAADLTEKDQQLIADTASKLYQDPTAEAGTSKEWHNPESGNSGTALLVEKSEINGMPCKLVRHTIKAKNFAEPRTVEFRRCRFPDGQWKIVM
jgi:surface antigen